MQCGLGIACQYLDPEKRKHIGVAEPEHLRRCHFSVLHLARTTPKPDRGFHFGKFFGQYGCQWALLPAVPCNPAICVSDLFHDPIGARRFWAKPVIAQLVADINHEQNRARHANRQSQEIDRGINRMPQRVPGGYGEAIFPEYGYSFHKIPFGQARGHDN